MGRRRRDGEVVLLDRKDHYEGGTVDQTTLLIKNSTRHDHGMYTCELENSVGKGNSSNGVYVNIQCKWAGNPNFLNRFEFYFS